MKIGVVDLAFVTNEREEKCLQIFKGKYEK
jgi:hypothetical protein